jgi:hypothetical protein
MLNDNTNAELFVCKGCKLTRPTVWWDTLQLDINTEMNWVSPDPVDEEEMPEELAGYCESPWSD